jgi:hypothetical protein
MAINFSDEELKKYGLYNESLEDSEPDFTPQKESSVGTTAQGMFGANFGLDALTGLGGTRPDDPNYFSPAELQEYGLYQEGNSLGKQIEGSFLATEVNRMQKEYRSADSQVQKIEEQLKLATEQNNQEEIDRLNLILNGTGVQEEIDESLFTFTPPYTGVPEVNFEAQQKYEKQSRAKEIGLLAYKLELNQETNVLKTKENAIQQSDALKITSQYPNKENVLYNLTQGTTLSQKIDIVGDIVGLSSVPMVQSLSAGAIATMVGGPMAGAVAAGTTSGVIDYNRSFFEYLEKKGVNITDPESLDAAYRNKELIEAAELYSTKRGVAIGALDALSFGIGTKVLAPAKVQNMMARAVINSAYQSPIQATLGGTGEALAQYFNLEEGENLNYADIAFEALGEFAFAPVEVTFAQLSAGRNEWVRAKNVSKENHLRKQIQFENTLNRAKEIDGQKSKTIKQQVDQRASDLQKVGQTEEESRSQAIDEFIDTSPEFKAAFEIYEDFTDSSRSPENFPTVVSNETGQYPNAFTVKTNEDGTFTIYDALGNALVNPKTNETYTYQSQQQALKIQRELSSISQIQYAIDTTQDVLLMQNADKDNPTIKGLGRILNNPYYDGISIQELEELNVSEQTLQLVKDATGSKNSISLSELKNILSKSQFDKIINQRAEDFKADPTYEELITISKLDNISAPKLKKLFKQKNIDVDFNSNAFKRLALQLTGETNIDSMSAAQRRILYAAINELPQSSQTIPLPDFSTRTYNLNDYSKALEAIIKLNDPSLKTIQDNTSLNAEEAKRLREDLVTAGYVKETNGRYKFVGTGNQKYNFDGSLKLEGEVNDNEKLEKIKSSILKQFKSIGLESTGIKFVDYVTNAQGQIVSDSLGSYDPVFDQIIIPIDRAGQDYKNNPKKYLSKLAVVLVHENWHALRQADVINESEYATLKNYILNTKSKGSKNTYYEQAIKEYTTEQSLELGAVQSEADVIEEAIARAFEDFAENEKSITGKPQQIFKKVSNFFERTSNAFQDNGFQNATDIFNKIQKGNISNRETGIVRTTLELDRVNSGFKNIIQTARAAGIDTDEVEDSFYSRLSDAPQLKYSLAKSGVNPLTREFLFGLKQNQFTDQMDVFTNVSENKDELLSNFLTKRRKQNLNNTKELRNLISVTGALSQIALETDIKKGLIEVNPDNTTPMYLVGDISKNRFTTMHRSKADAIRTAQLRGHMYYTPVGNNTKVTTVNVPIRAIGFHPRIYNVGNEGTVSNPYNIKGQQLFGIESNSIPLNKVSEENIEPLIGQAPRTKFSLKRTAGRLDNATVQELMEEANYKNLETYVNAGDNLIPFIIGLSKNHGSDFIAATLEDDFNFINSAVANFQSFENIQPRQNEIPNAQKIIKEITDASLENFPEYIVVYRGGNIKDQYNVIPVTTNKEAANIFASQDVGTAKDRANPQPSVLQEFLIPKSKVLANMNALMIPQDIVNMSDERAGVYAFGREMEFLVNREDLEISGIDRVPEIEVKKIHERIKKEKRKGEENYDDFIRQELLGLGGLAEPTLRTMDDREFINEQNKLKKLINDIDLSSINQEQLLGLLNHPALIEAEQRMFSIPIYETEIKTSIVLELINKANSYAGNTVEQGKKATFLIGLPASGKSYFAELLAAEQQAAIVDSDDAKRILPSYGTGLGANAVAPMSSQYSSIVLKTLSDNGSNIIIPSVGSSNKFKSIEKKIQMLKDKGYQVNIGLIDTDFNHALVRMLNRFVDSGRLIATDYFVDVDNTPRDTYNRLKSSALADNFSFLNNNFAQGQQTVEEDNSKLFRQFGSPRQIGIGDVRQSYAERNRLSEAIEQAVIEVKAQEDKARAGNYTSLVSSKASPEAQYAVLEQLKLSKNTPSDPNPSDVIDSSISNANRIKYSLKNSKPLNNNAMDLISDLTVYDEINGKDSTISLLLKGKYEFENTFNPIKVRQEIIDRYAGLVASDYSVGRKNPEIGDKILLASNSAAAAAFFADRSGEIFMQSFQHGFPIYDKKQGLTTVRSVSNLKGFEGQEVIPPAKIFEGILKNNDGNKLMLWQAVMRVQRETRFDKEGRAVKVTDAHRKQAAQALKDYPELKVMAEQYQFWNKHVVEFLVDTGMLTEKTAKIWTANSDYIPFFRPLEGMETGFKGPQIFGGLSINPFKKAKGSETKDIVDPITGISRNLRAAIAMGMKNVAMNRAMRNFVLEGTAQQVKGTQGPRPKVGHVRIRVEGETKTFKVVDPSRYEAATIFLNGDYVIENSAGAIADKFLRAVKSIRSQLITLSPSFWIAAFLRETFSVTALSGVDIKKQIPFVSQFKNFAKVLIGKLTGNLPESYIELRRAGIVTGYDNVVTTVTDTEELVKKLYAKEIKKSRSPIRKITSLPFDAFVKLWELFGEVNPAIDAAGRMAVWEDTLERTGNLAEANFQALEVLNFTKKGNNPVMQNLASWTMFLNPRIQGVDVFGRSLVGRYGIGKTLNRNTRMAEAWSRVLTVMAGATYYYMLVRDTDEYKEMDDDIINNNMIIPGSMNPTGYTFKLPKAFEVGALAITFPERMLRYMDGTDEGKDSIDAFKKISMSTIAINPLQVSAIEPLVENWLNYDFYTGNKIIPSYLETMAKEDGQLIYRATTPEMFKAAGDWWDTSPLYVENTVKGYGGTLGGYAISIADQIYKDHFSDVPAPEKQLYELPVLSSFIASPEGTQKQNLFYDLYRNAADLRRAFGILEKKLVDEGDFGALDFTDEYNLGMADALKEIDSTLGEYADELTELRELEVQVRNSSSFNSQEKAELLLEIKASRNDVLESIPALRKFYYQELEPQARSSDLDLSN